MNSTLSPDTRAISVLTEGARVSLEEKSRSETRIIDIRVPVIFSSPGTATVNFQIRGAATAGHGATVELWSLAETPRLLKRWRNTNDSFVLPYSQTLHVDASRVVAAGSPPTEEARITLLLRATRHDDAGMALIEIDSIDAAAPQP